MGSKLLLLISILSFSANSESLKHEFKDGVIKANIIKNNGYSSLFKKNGDYRFSIFDNDGSSKFDYILPWKPTHRSIARNSTKTFIGNLKRNGHEGVGELLIFDENGLVQSFTNVIHFDSTSESGNFFIIKNKNEKHELQVFDENLNRISSKIFDKNFDHHSLLSISPSGDRLSLSAISPDMSSRKKVKVYYGNDYEKNLEWNFDGLPIYQVNQLAQGISTLNVNHKLIAFKGPEKIWEFPERGRHFIVDSVEPSKNGKYLLVRDQNDNTNFVILKCNGNVIIDSENLKDKFSYLKENSRFSFIIKNESLVIANHKLKLVDVFSLKTGSRVKKLKLTNENIIDADNEFLLTEKNGKLKKLRLK